MVLPKGDSLLLIFIGESDKHEGMVLYEWIVDSLEKIEASLSGADGAIR